MTDNVLIGRRNKADGFSVAIRKIPITFRTLEDFEEKKLLEHEGTEQPTYMVIIYAVLEFCGIFGASFLVGSVMACATALLTKHTKIRQFPELEATLFVLMSYSTFLLAEVLNLTGIVAVLFCGICQAHYTYNNLSDESKSITKQFFNLLNFMAENFIFCYIGVSMFTFPDHHFEPLFVFGSFFAIILGRALNVYTISALLNLGRNTKISLNLQHMMFLSGLRGAIAFALSIRNTLTVSRQMILTTTLIIVIVTVVVCGGSTMSLLTWLGIPLGVNEEEEDEEARQQQQQQQQHLPQDEGSKILNRQNPPKSWMAKVWSKFDSRYMKPLLTHSNPTLMETLPSCCLPFARWLTSPEQLAKHPAMRFNTQKSSDGLVLDNDHEPDDFEVEVNDGRNISSAVEEFVNPMAEDQRNLHQRNGNSAATHI